jgi:thiol-disulfide isomerase/thioredoxin
MKHRILVGLAAFALLLPNYSAPAAESSPAATELKALITKIQTKLKDGKKTEADLGDEIKEFDALLAKHKGEKTDEVAQILVMKAMLYLEVLNNPEKGTQLLEQVKTDYPDTNPGKNAAAMVETQKIKRALVEGAKFPDFDEKDLAGKPLSVAHYKGKVVLVDFWATWCGPCVHELPNVIKSYEKHHAKGFEIIGISLDQDEQKLKSFIQEKNMTWQQFFDGKGWGNKLAGKYGVQSIPATYLLDGDGKIIGKDLRGDELEAAIAKAVSKS